MIGTTSERLEALDKLYPVWENHTLWTRFSKNAERYAEQTCLIFENEYYTYRQVKEHAAYFARCLYGLGIRSGDHVAVFLYNSPEYVYMMFALAKLGAIKIPINMKLSDEEKTYILKQSDASLAIGVRLPSDEMMRTLPGIRIISVSDSWEQFLKCGEAIPEELISQVEIENRNPYGISDIMYTSGSTSFPKGVVLTHDMLLRSSYATCRTRLMEEGRRLFIPIPFYHIFAYNEGILPMIYIGGTIIISASRFNPADSLRLMKEHHANDIICVSLVMLEILREGKPVPEDYPDLHAAYWASSCPEWVWDEGRRALGVEDVTTGYGMTECGSTSTILSPLAPKEYVKQYAGGLKKGGVAGCKEYGGNLIQLKICDLNTGRELPAGQQGEIVCRGRTVTPGYYKNAEANLKSFTDDGWFRTGDLGCISPEGLLTFTGRKNDLYKINGENVSPQFLDMVISRCPDVEQVEVVGIRHEKYGEVGAAFIDPGKITEEKKNRIEDYCRKKLAQFQVPRYFIYESHKNWPRTASGKVQKSKLKERAEKMLSQGLPL